MSCSSPKTNSKLSLQNKFPMQPSQRKFWCACHRLAAMKSTKWFARRSRPGEQLTRTRRTTASCTVTDSKIWMGTFGSWPSWSRTQLNLGEVQERTYAVSGRIRSTFQGKAVDWTPGHDSHPCFPALRHDGQSVELARCSGGNR